MYKLLSLIRVTLMHQAIRLESCIGMGGEKKYKRLTEHDITEDARVWSFIEEQKKYVGGTVHHCQFHSKCVTWALFLGVPLLERRHLS